MPVTRPLTLPEGSPAGDLLAALEPYLWVSNFGAFTVHGSWPRKQVHVTGIVKPPEMKSPPEPEDQGHAYVLADGMRSHLFGRAQTAICAAEDAGYRHWQHPEITVGGDIRLSRGVEPDILRTEVTVRLWLTPA